MASVVSGSFTHHYPDGTATAMGAPATVGDVIVAFASNAGAAASSLTCTGATAVFTQQDNATVSGDNLTCLTAPVTGAGTPTLTVSADADVGWSAWIVRGLLSATAHKVGHATGVGNPLTVSLSPTITCSLFVGWANENLDEFASFNGSITQSNHDATHNDANGFQLDVAPGSYTPGANVTSEANNMVLAIYLPNGGAVPPVGGFINPVPLW